LKFDFIVLITQTRLVSTEASLVCILEMDFIIITLHFVCFYECLYVILIMKHFAHNITNMKNCLFIILFLIFPLLGFSQTDTLNQSWQTEQHEIHSLGKHGVGFASGLTTGVGLSYRHYFDKFRVQLTFGPVITSGEFIMSSGLGLMYELGKTEKTSFFLYQGSHLFYDSSEVLTFFGVGIGMEFIVFKQLSYNLMLGFAAWENFDRLLPTGEMGLYYRF
jgi:hypothetical protein